MDAEIRYINFNTDQNFNETSIYKNDKSISI